MPKKQKLLSISPLKAALLGITLVLAAFIIPKAISPHWPPSLFLSDAGFNDIVIHARGTNGQEKVALYINDAPVQFWNLTTSFQDYTYTPPTAITVNNLSIHFLNDRWEPESGINYDVQVDYITVNGTRYDSEHNSTISTGSWDQNDWCAPGNKSQEWLHCSGSFTYNIPAGTVVGIGAPITLTPPTLTGTLDSQSQITLTWNTVPEATSYRINRGGTFYQEITGTTLIETGLTPDTEYVYSVRAKKDENISSGSNVVRLKTVGTSSGLNVVSHEAIDITETTAKLRFTASENVQAYTDYGTDINYGLQTNQETSFDYATHVQTLSDLTPGTQYFYKIVVINQASEQVTDTGTFTTTGGVSAPVCGNNQVEAGEQCDDGNTVGGDGCNGTCQVEQVSQGPSFVNPAGEVTSPFTPEWTDANPPTTRRYDIWVDGVDNGPSVDATQRSWPPITLTPGTHTIELRYWDTVVFSTYDSISMTVIVAGTPPPTGSSVTFDQIKAAGRSANTYPTKYHYLAEFLEQRPDVHFWTINESAQTITPVASPQSTGAIQLPAPSGGDDAARLEAVINAAPNRKYTGQGTYKLSSTLDINVPAQIWNLNANATGSVKVMVKANASDVKFYNASLDMKNVGSAYQGVEVSENAHRFTFVGGTVKNMMHTATNSGGAIRLRGSDDYYVVGNTITDLYNDCGTTASICRSNALWISGWKSTGSSTYGSSNGGMFANNYIRGLQTAAVSSSGGNDAEVFSVQNLTVSGMDYILANRALDAGKRLAKFQESNGAVLSNHYEWKETHGPLGRNTRLTAVGMHYSSNLMVNNNRIKVSNDRNWSQIFAIISQGNQNTNMHFDYNDIEINNTPGATYDRLITYMTGPNDGTDISFKNNTIRGSGSVNYYHSFKNGWASNGGAFVKTGNAYGVPFVRGNTTN